MAGKNPVQKIIDAIDNSMALFALITSQVVYDTHTRDWVVFEIAVAKVKDVPVFCWIDEAVPKKSYPPMIQNITDYVTFKGLSDEECNRIVTAMVDKAFEVGRKPSKTVKPTQKEERAPNGSSDRREEKPKKQRIIINKLEALVTVFNEEITKDGDVTSIVWIASRIAYDPTIREKTMGWYRLFSYLDNELTDKGSILDKKVKQRKEEFTSLFRDFSSLLSLLRDFKEQFYEMINDTKKFKSFSDDSKFKKEYIDFYEKFNRYMDKLDHFSDEVKAEFGTPLNKNLIKHVKDFDELHPEKIVKL